MQNKQKAVVMPLDSSPKAVVAAGEKTSIQVLIGADKAPNFAMRCFTIEPGGSMPKHTNTVEHEQYVLSGSAEAGIGSEVVQVKEGDVIYIPAGVPHWYKTVGDEAYRFLCLVPNEQDTIELVDE